MTRVQIELPDQLAHDAQRAGLLSSTALEQLLRQQLQTQAGDELARLVGRLDTEFDDGPLTPEAAQAEIVAMRAERRTGEKR